MNSLIRSQFRADSIVVDFYCMHNRDKRFTLAHFKCQGVNHMTIRRAIERFNQCGSSKFKPITGRPRYAVTASTVKTVDTCLKENPAISIRNLALQAGVSPRTVGRIRERLGYKSYKAQPAPKLVKDQEARIISGATKIYKKLVPSGGGYTLIIYDEMYVQIV